MPVSKGASLAFAADGVGAVSVALGGFLSVAPLTSGRWLGLTDTDIVGRRALGTADLGLGITIIAGRSSRWRWRAVAARALLHLLFAREYVRNSRPAQRRRDAAALFIIDAGIAIGLRKDRRSA